MGTGGMGTRGECEEQATACSFLRGGMRSGCCAGLGGGVRSRCPLLELCSQRASCAEAQGLPGLLRCELLPWRRVSVATDTRAWLPPRGPAPRAVHVPAAAVEEERCLRRLWPWPFGHVAVKSSPNEGVGGAVSIRLHRSRPVVVVHESGPQGSVGSREDATWLGVWAKKTRISILRETLQTRSKISLSPTLNFNMCMIFLD